MTRVVLTVLLLTWSGGTHADQGNAPPAPLQRPSAPQAPRGVSGAVPTPPSVPISPRRSAAFGAMIVAGLLLLQYAHRRKAFILLWASGWLLIAPAMLLIARGYDTGAAAHFAVGLSQFLGICTATLFFWSADLYRQTRFVRPARLRILILVGAWFLLAPMVLGPASVLAPGYLISAILLAFAGAMYAAVLIERRMIGAGLVAFVLLGLAVSNLTTAVVLPRMAATGQFAFEILVVNAVLYTFGALGIHQLVFEDMTYELQTTNRRLEAAREELLQAAITDPLTGCHNRRFLEQVMDRELQRHARFHVPLSLLSSTSIGSSRSTTRLATRPANACCSTSRAFTSATSARPTTCSAGAATSSSS